MVRVLTLMGGLACLGIAGAAGYQALALQEVPPAGPAKAVGLVAEEPVHDFGNVGQMETLRAEFRLTNHFPTAVTIKDMIKGCSCADAEISSERLEPGQEATLTIGWRTGSRRGKTSEVVTVLARPEGTPGSVGIQLRMKAHVEPDVHCDPDEIRFERQQSGAVTLRFTPGRMADVRIQSVYASVSALQTFVDPTAGTVVVRYDPAKLDGDELTAAVMVQTTSTKEPWVSVPVAFTGVR